MWNCGRVTGAVQLPWAAEGSCSWLEQLEGSAFGVVRRIQWTDQLTEHKCSPAPGHSGTSRAWMMQDGCATVAE